MSLSSKRKLGRPPAGDSGEKISEDYVRVTIWMKPAMRAQMKALCSLTGIPGWRIVDRALAEYIKRQPAADRRALETLAERIEARQK